MEERRLKIINCDDTYQIIDLGDNYIKWDLRVTPLIIIGDSGD